MNPTTVRIVHITALTVIVISSTFSLFFIYSTPYPDELRTYQWYVMAQTLVVAALVCVRLWQVVDGNVLVGPKSPIEKTAVPLGMFLIIAAIPGGIALLVYSFRTGQDSLRIYYSVAVSALWIGVAMIELVIANRRRSASQDAEGRSRFGPFVLAALMLVLGIIIGVVGFFSLILFGMTH